MSIISGEKAMMLTEINGRHNGFEEDEETARERGREREREREW